MNYGQLKTTFERRLKRRDLPAGASADYIQLGITRLQRSIRVPALEYTSTETINETYNPTVGISVPTDVVQIINVSHEHGVMNRAAFNEVLQGAQTAGIPTQFTQRGDKIILSPAPLNTFQIKIHYYRILPKLLIDTDTNWLSENADDIIIYAALVYAADDYLDKRGPGFAQSFNDLRDELQGKFDAAELTTAVVAPGFKYDDLND